MIDHRRLKAWPFGERVHRYDTRDVIWYALGCGFGFDPLDERQLDFVLETRLKLVPSMAAVIGTPGSWWREPGTGVTWQKVLHAEQDLRLYGSLPVAATLIGHNRVTHLHDRGRGRGAVAGLTRRIVDAKGELLAEAHRIEVLRADGGFSADDGVHDSPPPRLPAFDPGDATPDRQVRLPTVPQAALIYRQSGDPNPIHAEPASAREAGFDRPILHGLCSFGLATHAVLRAVLDYAATRLRRVALRFKTPVYPGETLRFAFWRQLAGTVRFRAWAEPRDELVLDNGIAEFDRPWQAAPIIPSETT